MTPLKRIILDGLGIITEDFSGIKTLVCVAEDERQAEWLTSSLAAYHKVEVVKPLKPGDPGPRNGKA